MTLNEIIVASLERLDRGNDNQTIDHYRAKFTDNANKAVKIIAKQYRGCRKETMALTDGAFSTDDLSRECLKIVEVRDGGKQVDFYQDVDGTGTVTCVTGAASVDVLYRFLPRPMSSTSDVPEIPNHLHDIVPHYIVACERCGGDPDTQGTASADFQLFNARVAEIESCKLGAPRSYKLLNY